MVANIFSAGKSEDTFDLTKVPNERISSNGPHSYLHEYVEEQNTHLFIFSGWKPDSTTYIRLFKFYDNITFTYSKLLCPTLVLRFIPKGLEERNVILDVDEELYKKLHITNNPELLFVNHVNEVLFRTHFFDLTEIEHSLKSIVSQRSTI